jgi:phage-related protein
MTQRLSVATAIEANRLSSSVPFLCLIDLEVVNPTTGLVVTTQRIARNPEDVVFNGDTYMKGSFDIQLTHEAGKPSEVQLIVNDYTQTIQSYMEQYGGGVGSNVTFYLVNGAALTKPADIIEYFQIIGATASEYVQTFTLGAENALMQTFPRRRQTRDFCQWRYQSAECGYPTNGAKTSCDLTLQGPNGCEAHGNSVNFGAFPGLNSNGYRYV